LAEYPLGIFYRISPIIAEDKIHFYTRPLLDIAQIFHDVLFPVGLYVVRGRKIDFYTQDVFQKIGKAEELETYGLAELDHDVNVAVFGLFTAGIRTKDSDAFYLVPFFKLFPVAVYDSFYLFKSRVFGFGFSSFALGTSISKGKRPSSAMRTKNMRTASERVSPIPSRTRAALFFVSLFIRTLIIESQVRTNVNATFVDTM